jgi:PAS domain S-box-containing protein
MAKGAANIRATSSGPGWKPWLFAGFMLLLAAGAEQTVEVYQKSSQLQHEKTHVISELSQLRARLESYINGNLLLINGLSAVIRAQPDIDQAGFARIARGLVDESQVLRNVTGAPDMVISLIHPISGNEAAIGLDYRSHPTQREAAMKAVASGGTVVAGPMQLIQGGSAIIARKPVFLADGDSPRLWGLVSAVIDTDRLYRLAGLPKLSASADLDLAIRGKDGAGPQGEIFFGDPAVFSKNPVTLVVSLPGGSWQMAALPYGGWGKSRPDVLPVRLIGLLLALMLASMVFLLTRSNQRLHGTTLELRESQAMFEGFMANLPAEAFVYDTQAGVSLFQNRWLDSHFPGADPACGADMSAELERLKSGPQLMQRQLRRHNDESRYCDALRFLLPSLAGRELVGGIILDVTERVLAEQDLASNRALLRTLLDTLPDLVWLKDPDGFYLACNARFEALFGAKEAEIIGKRDHDFVAPQLADFFLEKDRIAMAAGAPVSNEETVTFASDGHQELLETTKAPLHDETGALIGVLGIARDISRHRLTEDHLRASSERLQTAESIAHIGNWAYRFGDEQISCSGETYRIFGRDPKRPIDLAWLQSRLHPEDREVHKAYRQALRNSKPGTDIPEFRFHISRNDGAERLLSVRSRVEFSAQGDPVRILGTVQDITESAQMQQQLKAKLEELTRWQAVMLGREDRVRQLKAEINRLLAEHGQPMRYPSQANTL